MAKGKNKGTAAATPPKCTCEDPYQCICGNRPERPSRGHKWYPEDQIWAGKGHKQKGASGQTALVSEQAKVTTTGQTQVAQWQRLPTQLLQEFCKSQKRPNPSFKNLGSHEKYRYRCIVHDPKKDSDKDLFFVPAQAVTNEEQAQEESALLALLQLTPNLPHERKLPDPYKATWLNAIKAMKEAAKPPSSTKKDGVTSLKSIEAMARINDSKNDETGAGPETIETTRSGAVSSTNLTLSSRFISHADKRKRMEEKRRVQNARIRKHENIRRANQNHPVFMSVSIRQQIERILRGDTSNNPNLDTASDDEEDGEDINNDDILEENVIKTYVTHRLYSEGFSRRQARSAYKEAVSCNSNIVTLLDVDNEASWDRIYEECLQWLMVHLNEDQLPEGFDPRGRTLDVVIPIGTAPKNSNETISINNNEAAIAFAACYGITIQEASLIHDRALKESKSPLEVFGNVIQMAAGIVADSSPNEDVRDHAVELFEEEIEALAGIYDSNFTMNDEQDQCSRVRISIVDDYQLDTVVRKGVYPYIHPKTCTVQGKWQSKVGMQFHLELARKMSNYPLGAGMIFDIVSDVQELLQSDELKAISMLSYLGVEETIRQPIALSMSPAKQMPDRLVKPTSNVADQKPRRPKEKRRTFWTIHPKDTTAAIAFPKVSLAMERTRMSLPAANSKRIFLDAVKEAERLGSRVVLVTGETGSGKSTQLPAYLLEDDPIGSKIVVVQPRRIAATGVANRVAEERGEKQAGIGSVGYVVRGDSALCDRSRLVFCTTGVLLRQFQVDGALDCLTTIVIDEVHERNLDGDILLGMLKKILPTKPHLRVILMSATLATNRFQTYWSNTSVPHVHIPGRTFPVSDFFLEDVLRVTGYIPSKKKKGYTSRNNSVLYDLEDEKNGQQNQNADDIEPEQPNTAAIQHGIPIEELVKRVDQTTPDTNLICQLLKYIISNKESSDDGSILVFLAGAPEIKNVEAAIKSKLLGLRVTVLPLHGGLQAKEQGRVFQPSHAGFTKIVLSTNVAETSVTIPDCTVVIDTGREKQASYDPVNRMPQLVEQFASKASMKQRRGRAGRVREGTCYKLVSQSTFESLPDHSAPEIHRVALDQTLLQLLFLGFENGLGSFTSTLLDPPSRASLDAATFSLIKLGAIERVNNDGALSITPLGSHLAGIPAPPVVGKMLVMGSILGCRSAALAMAAGISLGRSIFLRLDKSKSDDIFDASKIEKVLAQRDALAKEAGQSDHAMLAYAFLKWQATENGMRNRFCESLGIGSNLLREMMQLYNQLHFSLVEAGFSATPESDRYTSSWRIIQTCAVSAMSPCQLVKVRRPATKYHETAEGAKEIDGVAKELTFYVRGDSGKEERVFIHPSSVNFSIGSYGCPFLVFNSMVRTSKPFMRDVTECNAYALLLFGGELQIQASKGIVTVDNWAELAANARIGSLVGGLRRRIDSLLAEKVVTPTIDISAFPEMQVVIKLVRTEGLGT